MFSLWFRILIGIIKKKGTDEKLNTISNLIYCQKKQVIFIKVSFYIYIHNIV